VNRSHNRLWIPFVIIVLVALLAVPAVMAQPRSQDSGFFLRLSAGGGTVSTSIEEGGVEEEFSGTAGDVNFAVGGIVSPNLAIHGSLFGWLISDPDYSVNGATVGVANLDVDVSAFGAGLTFYFMPANLYVSSSLGFGKMSFDGGGVTVETDTGVIVDFTVGKEWWVGDSWGIGVAGGFSYHSIPVDGAEENLTGTSFAIRFTATHN
jgi:hypothetical protein